MTEKLQMFFWNLQKKKFDIFKINPLIIRLVINNKGNKPILTYKL